MEVGALARLLVAYGAGNKYVTCRDASPSLDAGMDAVFGTRADGRASDQAQLIVGAGRCASCRQPCPGDLSLVNRRGIRRWLSAAGFVLAESRAARWATG
jgi:hypothetical protein